MRFAADERGRVPFALVGVFLLVGSSALGASLATRGPSVADRSVDAAMHRVDAETTAALRVAARRAAVGAARDPVTTPANTAVGEVLGANDTFRDYLRLRVYLAARTSLRAVVHRRGAVTARASLPPTTDRASIRRAIRSVSVAGVDEGTALRVTVRNVTLAARRGDTAVVERTVNRTLTVSVPVLALHDRTRAFQRRLDADPVRAPGLARRTTAGLLATAQARGLAQYGGVPIQNVLANRHVELSTNAGLLASQRAAFGRSDPDARRGVRRATARVGLTDVLVPYADSTVVTAATDRLPEENAPPEASASTSTSLPRAAPPSDGRTLVVGVNGSADDAFVGLLRGTGDTPGFETLLDDGYRGRVEVRTSVAQVREGRDPGPDAPGPGWSLSRETESRETSVDVLSVTDAPAAERDERRYETAARRVTVTHTVERTWRRPNRSATSTTAAWTDVYRVQIAVVGGLTPVPGPRRPVAPQFERGGALDGPNLREVGPASDEALAARGGIDAVARDAVEGEVPTSQTVDGDRPSTLRPWVYADVADLRDRVRNVSVAVPARTAATGNANPAARLAATVRDRRADLVDAPSAYDGVADRVRVAARAAYLDRLLARLDARANRTAAGNEGVREALAGCGVDADRANRLAANRSPPTPPAESHGGAPGLGGPTTFVPDGDPAYLSLGPVSGERVDGVGDGARYYGLAARNVNLFSLPYGDLTDAVLDGLVGTGDTTSLHTAGTALVAANDTLSTTDDETLERRRDALTRRVSGSLWSVRNRASTTLYEETSLSPAARADAVEAAFARWDGAGRRAVAASNGSLATALAEEVAPEDPIAADRLAATLRVELRDVTRSERVRVSQTAVNDSVSRTRDRVRDRIRSEVTARGQDAARRVVAERLNRSLGAVPAGLPLSPTLNPWVATTNVWVVEARGEYARFSVSSSRGGPAAVTYVRDGQSVSLDVDGDGEAETLGRADRVGFDVRTVVVVVVPSGRTGVGDVDGNVDERSSAWSDDGPGARCDTPTGRCPRE
jgi:hypothetical protein